MLAVASGCELDIQRGPGWLLVKVRGLDQSSPEYVPLADQLWSVLECHFIYRLVLELDEVPVLDSHLIGQLVRLQEKMRQSGGTLRICGLSPYNRKVLHLSRLDDRLCPYGTRQEAVMGHFRPGNPR